MPIIIIKRFNSPEHGYSVEEAIAVFNGTSAKNYVDHLNNQETLLRMSIKRFIEIQRHVRSILPPPEKDEPLELIPKWKAGLKEEEVTAEMHQERSQIKAKNHAITMRNARKNNEWKDKYISKVIELASSWIKDFPSDFISYFQEFGQLPTITECHYSYKEVEFVN